MRLDKNKDDFIALINETKEYTTFDSSLIEKDYYVTMLLEEASKRIEGLVFKGGTSLSKCYKLIEQFSEDIDLSLNNKYFSQKFKRNAIKEMVDIIECLGLSLKNKDKIIKHTHGNYNCFRIGYPTVYKMNENIEPEILLELVYIERTYPTEIKMAQSYIGEFLEQNNYKDIIDKYDLQQFNIEVQSLERTLVDKVFAICDYYILKKERRNSRHIYDIYKILPYINLSNKKLKDFVKEIRNIRKKNKNAVTAQDEFDINKILKEIVSTDYYKKDFNKVTSLLLTKPVKYEEIITSLNKIIESDIFSK